MTQHKFENYITFAQHFSFITTEEKMNELISQPKSIILYGADWCPKCEYAVKTINLTSEILNLITNLQINCGFIDADKYGYFIPKYITAVSRFGFYKESKLEHLIKGFPEIPDFLEKIKQTF